MDSHSVDNHCRCRQVRHTQPASRGRCDADEDSFPFILLEISIQDDKTTVNVTKRREVCGGGSAL